MPDVGRSLSFSFLIFLLHDSLHKVFVKESILVFDVVLNGRIILKLILKKYSVTELAQCAVQSGLLWTV